ncbi:MAG: polyribonucleotide nucleotidyltransferase [Clostridia bacterium]|nr:polyribonucleotide nucleotidyltransferase [Clostridia bacterium]
MQKNYSMDLAGRVLTLETGKMAGLANGSVLVRYGDTTVLVNATASKEPKEGIDFFPLSVEYNERLYAVGKIPGGFNKREGKPTEKAILTSRAIDRPLRPLFPKDFRNDVVIDCLVLSVEQDCSPEVCAMIGASAALSISDIPFGGPTAAVNVGFIDGKPVINPTEEQRKVSRLNATIAGTQEKIAMIEAGAYELTNEEMLDSIKAAHVEIKKLCEFIKTIQNEIGKPKFEYKKFEVDEAIYSLIYENFKDKMYQAVQAVDKIDRDDNLTKLNEEVKAWYIERYDEDKYEEDKSKISESLYKLEKKTVRKMILEEHKRVDGRGIYDIRPLSAGVDIIPRVHGSGLFSRGRTQVLSIATLGMKSEEQELDGLDNETAKRYMHQYNFPGYSVGEAKTSRGPGRREIGHGALAEKALVPVLPSVEEFPYAIRVVSEILSSNGSTSQGSICASTLALMDAGVPIKKPVAGISTGLITDENDPNNYIVITDIQGIEDFFGDMDFKVGGTRDGITAIQVDIKVDGLTYDIIAEAFDRTLKARTYILDEIMAPVISEPRPEISKYAPKIISMQISTDKIKDVIGSGGKTINKIIEETGVKIDIEEDGSVFIYSDDMAKAIDAQGMIEDIVREIEVGGIYTGKVVKINDKLGAFISLGSGKEGLLHISKIAKERVNRVEDYMRVGDEVTVKCIGIDDQGRINLSRKDLYEEGE